MTKQKFSYIIALCLFGTTGLILRWTSVPSEWMVLARGAMGSVLIACFVLLRGGHLSGQAIRRNLGWLIFGGVSLGLNWVFLFAAYRYTTVAIASLCNYMAPLMVIFLSPVLFGEKLSGRKLLCVAAAALGICLVSGVFRGLDGWDPMGILLGLGAALGFVGIIIGNKKVSKISPYDRVIVQLAISALTVLPYVLWRSRGVEILWDPASIAGTLILAVVHTAFAYCLYFGAMGALPVQTVALWGYIEPVVSVVCSALVLGEPLGLSGLLGAALILIAAAVSEQLN